jgi:hypothetical protein
MNTINKSVLFQDTVKYFIHRIMRYLYFILFFIVAYYHGRLTYYLWNGMENISCFIQNFHKNPLLIWIIALTINGAIVIPGGIWSIKRRKGLFGSILLIGTLLYLLSMLFLVSKTVVALINNPC